MRYFCPGQRLWYPQAPDYTVSMNLELQPVIISAILITSAALMLWKLLGCVERSRTDTEAIQSVFVALVLIACTITGVIAAHRIFPITSTNPTSSNPFTKLFPHTSLRPSLDIVMGDPVVPPPSEPARLTLPPNTLTDTAGRVCIFDIENDQGIVITAEHDPTHYLSHADLYVVGVHPSQFQGRQIRLALDTDTPNMLVMIPGMPNYDRQLERLIAAFNQ